jgi:hypothetical protein
MERMRDVLRGSLGRSLRALPEEDRLAAAWPVACGSALAGHGEPQAACARQGRGLDAAVSADALGAGQRPGSHRRGEAGRDTLCKSRG